MPSDLHLRGLRVAITGGTSGLGLGLVRLLVARGARVAFVARTAGAVSRIADDTGACGIVGDVGRREDVYPIALQVTGNLGGTVSKTHRSSVAASGAIPGDDGNTVASAAGRLSITVSRVSIVVPCRA